LHPSLIARQHMLGKRRASREPSVPGDNIWKLRWRKVVESKAIVSNEAICLDRNRDVGDREVTPKHVGLRSFAPHDVAAKSIGTHTATALRQGAAAETVHSKPAGLPCLASAVRAL
jgi:hypothetical protein